MPSLLSTTLSTPRPRWAAACRKALIGLAALGGCEIATAQPSFQTLVDPTEQSFSISLPSDRENALGLWRAQGNFKLPRSWVTSRSRDGAHQWFIGDPAVPIFQTAIPQETLNVMAASGVPRQQATQVMTEFMKKEGVAIAPYQSAAEFSKRYAQRRFGHQPGFTLQESQPHPTLAKAAVELATRLGNPRTTIDAARTRFSFQGHTGEIWVSSGYLPGDQSMWSADVSGFTTQGNHNSEVELFSQAVLSMDISKKWLAQENRAAQQRQAAFSQQMQQNQINRRQQQQMLTQQHQQRMRDRQNAFNAHQRGVAERSALMDQQHQSWMNTQNRNDQQHDAFVRSIQERTLVTTDNPWGSNSFEVDAGANNYYVDPLNDSYFGTDQPLDAGQVPDGYQAAEESWGTW